MNAIVKIDETVHALTAASAAAADEFGTNVGRVNAAVEGGHCARPEERPARSWRPVRFVMLVLLGAGPVHRHRRGASCSPAPSNRPLEARPSRCSRLSLNRPPPPPRKISGLEPAARRRGQPAGCRPRGGPARRSRRCPGMTKRKRRGPRRTPSRSPARPAPSSTHRTGPPAWRRMVHRNGRHQVLQRRDRQDHQDDRRRSPSRPTCSPSTARGRGRGRAGEAGAGFAVVARGSPAPLAQALRPPPPPRRTAGKIEVALQRSDEGGPHQHRGFRACLAQMVDQVPPHGHARRRDRRCVRRAVAGPSTRVNKAVSDMDKVTQANRRPAAEESAAAAEELFRPVTHELAKLVGDLRVLVRRESWPPSRPPVVSAGPRIQAEAPVGRQAPRPSRPEAGSVLLLFPDAAKASRLRCLVHGF